MHNCMENRDRRYVPKVNRYALRILSLAKALEREREAPPGISVGSDTPFQYLTSYGETAANYVFNTIPDSSLRLPMS